MLRKSSERGDFLRGAANHAGTRNDSVGTGRRFHANAVHFHGQDIFNVTHAPLASHAGPALLIGVIPSCYHTEAPNFPVP